MTASRRDAGRATVWVVGGVVVALVVILAMVALWRAGPSGTGSSSRDIEADIDTPVSAVNEAALGEEVADCPPEWTEPGRFCRWIAARDENATPGPAVILLHGYTSTPNEIIAVGGWETAALDRALTVVAPGGIGQSWNAGTCCAEAQRRGVDDAAYLDGLVDAVAALPQVDPSQIYTVGFSNGGLMVYKLLCVAGDRVAGAVSVAGTDVAGCPASEPVPLLHLHGTADEVVPYRGGLSVQSILLGVDFPSVTGTLKKMVVEQNCDPEAVTADEPDWVVTRYENCDDDTSLELRTVEGGGHRWDLAPGVDTTEVVLDYFGIG